MPYFWPELLIGAAVSALGSAPSMQQSLQDISHRAAIISGAAKKVSGPPEQRFGKTLDAHR